VAFSIGDTMQPDNSYENKGKLDKAAVRMEMEYNLLIYTKDRWDAAEKYSRELARLLTMIVEEP
jgi:hypothetical protein